MGTSAPATREHDIPIVDKPAEPKQLPAPDATPVEPFFIPVTDPAKVPIPANPVRRHNGNY